MWYEELLTARSAGVPWRINRSDLALIVVDMQNMFVQEGGAIEVPAARSRLKTVREVLEASREASVPVFHTRIVHPRSDLLSRLYELFPAARGKAYLPSDQASQIHEALAPREGEIVIDKMGWSAFVGTSLDLLLRMMRTGISSPPFTLAFCGVVTNVCVESSMRSAFDLNYRVVMIEDACAALDPVAHAATAKNVAYALGRVISAEEYIAILKQGENNASAADVSVAEQRSFDAQNGASGGLGEFES